MDDRTNEEIIVDQLQYIIDVGSNAKERRRYAVLNAAVELYKELAEYDNWVDRTNKAIERAEIMLKEIEARNP